MLGLDNFTWMEQWSPMFLTVILLIAATYYMYTGPYLDRTQGSAVVPIRQKWFFYSGLFLAYMALGGPLDLLGHLMFSAHMLSMSVIYLIAVPLLLLGMPAWMLKRLLSRRWLQPFAGLTHPIMGLLLFNGLLSFYHIPLVLDYVMVHYVLHSIVYLVLFLSAAIMWWHIVDPVPEWSRMSELKKMGYIIANSILLYPACGLIIFAGSPIYDTYSDPAAWATAMGYCVTSDVDTLLQMFRGGPTFFAFLDLQEDQQLGGIIMKMIQELIFGTMLAYIFYLWYRRENPNKEDDDLNPKAEFYRTTNS